MLSLSCGGRSPEKHVRAATLGKTSCGLKRCSSPTGACSPSPEGRGGDAVAKKAKPPQQQSAGVCATRGQAIGGPCGKNRPGPFLKSAMAWPEVMQSAWPQMSKAIQEAVEDGDLRGALRRVDGFTAVAPEAKAVNVLPTLFPAAQKPLPAGAPPEAKASDVERFLQELDKAFKHAPTRRSAGPGGAIGEHWSWMPAFVEDWAHVRALFLDIALGSPQSSNRGGPGGGGQSEAIWVRHVGPAPHQQGKSADVSGPNRDGSCPAPVRCWR